MRLRVSYVQSSYWLAKLEHRKRLRNPWAKLDKLRQGQHSAQRLKEAQAPPDPYFGCNPKHRSLYSTVTRPSCQNGWHHRNAVDWDDYIKKGRICPNVSTRPGPSCVWPRAHRPADKCIVSLFCILVHDCSSNEEHFVDISVEWFLGGWILC